MTHGFVVLLGNVISLQLLRMRQIQSFDRQHTLTFFNLNRKVLLTNFIKSLWSLKSQRYLAIRSRCLPPLATWILDNKTTNRRSFIVSWNLLYAETNNKIKEIYFNMDHRKMQFKSFPWLSNHGHNMSHYTMADRYGKRARDFFGALFLFQSNFHILGAFLIKQILHLHQSVQRLHSRRLDYIVYGYSANSALHSSLPIYQSRGIITNSQQAER